MAYTQYFETARTRPNFTSFATHAQDTDLYVTGDLYQNDVVTPAVILVPRSSVSFFFFLSDSLFLNIRRCLSND